MKIILTGGGGATVYHEVATVDESSNAITFTGPLDATATMEIDDVVSMTGWRLRIYRKSDKGVVTEVEADKGAIFGNMESEVTDYYLPNIFADSKYIKLTDQTSVSTLDDRLPSDVSTQTALTSGSDGTAPTTQVHWTFNHSAFDNDPIRIWSNSDMTLKAEFDEMETYARARSATDFPITIVGTSSNLSKANLQILGNTYQKTEKVYKLIVGTWLKKTDPFSSSPVAPDRNIPSIGHSMGAWVRTIRDRGIHNVPALFDINLRGVTGVVTPIILTNSERTDLFDAGLNIIQDIKGVGVQIRNWVTPSTLAEEGVITWKHGNGVIMGNFIRESVKESLAPSQNEPNVFRNVLSGKTKIISFMMGLARRGSNLSTPEGETFGQLFDSEGNAEPLTDLFDVIADPSNNTRVDLKAGNRDYDIFFSYPTPTGSIEVGVGIII